MGIARINLAAWAALAIGLVSVFTIRFAAPADASIWYAMTPTMLTLPAYIWAVLGHWDCPRNTPMTLAGIGISGTAMAAFTALSAAASGDAIPVLLGTCMCISSRILTSFMIKSPMLMSDISRLK
ncbi:hypothetical protein LF599_07370 [Pseudodesulfovibrio thermohalotolerans]|uniref:hypothetical protein n=1 Tax=Pseudodesulfovibrio thermohalotolerans TaxID=2880651 RepID=UPI0022B9D5E4|nr:hypothetical protein [Pseudodesulfovibrio thermohalotolerans]WFS63974.1 hypothetical protein LF599_07370 [Pseudodesulfovibrio thermohalotolerans]